MFLCYDTAASKLVNWFLKCDKLHLMPNYTICIRKLPSTNYFFCFNVVLFLHIFNFYHVLNNVVIKGSVNVYFIKWFQWWKIYNVFFFLKQIHVFVYVINSSFFYGTNQNSVLFWQESENILCNININFATICYKNAMTALMCKRIEKLMTMIMMVFMKWITFQSCKVNGKVNDIKLRLNYFFRSFNWEKTFWSFTWPS